MSAIAVLLFLFAILMMMSWARLGPDLSMDVMYVCMYVILCH